MGAISTNIWQGERVRLRAVEPDDWEAFHAKDADTESARSGYWIPLPRSSAASKEWAEGEAKQATGNAMRFAVETLDGELVGSINTVNCNPRNGTFGYGIAIFGQHWRKGYAREAIQLVLRYYFRELRYQKVTTSIYDFNEASLALHQSLGFVREGRLRRMGFTDGKYFDEIVVGMTSEEFEARLADTL